MAPSSSKITSTIRSAQLPQKPYAELLKQINSNTYTFKQNQNHIVFPQACIALPMQVLLLQHGLLLLAIAGYVSHPANSANA
jgi:hypothetical protein